MASSIYIYETEEDFNNFYGKNKEDITRNLKIIDLYKHQLDDMEFFQELVVRSDLREDINSFIIDIKDAVGFA